jgi:hypothetical protein
MNGASKSLPGTFNVPVQKPSLLSSPSFTLSTQLRRDECPWHLLGMERKWGSQSTVHFVDLHIVSSSLGSLLVVRTHSTARLSLLTVVEGGMGSGRKTGVSCRSRFACTWEVLSMF